MRAFMILALVFFAVGCGQKTAGGIPSGGKVWKWDDLAPLVINKPSNDIIATLGPADRTTGHPAGDGSLIYENKLYNPYTKKPSTVEILISNGKGARMDYR